MKKIYSTLVFIILCCSSLFSQVSKIENTRVTISSSTDTMLIKYDLIGKREVYNIKMEVIDQNKQRIFPKNVFGDIGKTVQPGKDKSILWDMFADRLDLAGHTLNVRIKGDVFVPSEKTKAWIPWLYIVSGASALAGTYTYMQANRLYESYDISSNTVNAEDIHSSVDSMLNVCRIAYGAASVFGIAGVIVHIKHHKENRKLAFNYWRSQNVNLLSLTFNF
jgi:hypothetical protein